MNRLYKILFFILACGSIVINIWLFTILIQAKRENNGLRDKVNELDRQYAAMRSEFQERSEYLDRYDRSPEFRERVARERLGYARPDEIIFRFED